MSGNENYNQIKEMNSLPIVEMYRTLTFADMMKMLSIKEATIVSLRLG